MHFIANDAYADQVGHKSTPLARIPNPKAHKGLMWVFVNIYILWKVSSVAKTRFPNTDILLLSYETISFAVCRLLFSNLRRAYIFNHNNIDQLEDSVVRRLLFRTLRAPTKHCVYELFIKEHLESFPKFEALVISHPLVFNWTPQGCDKLINIFSPHVLDSPKLTQLDRFAGDNKNFMIRAKFHKYINNTYLTTKPYFEDFNQELDRANIVLVFTKFKYRSSGVAYAAISSGRILIIQESLFSLDLAARYTDQVFLFSAIDGLFDLLCQIARDRSRIEIKKMDVDTSSIEKAIFS